MFSITASKLVIKYKVTIFNHITKKTFNLSEMTMFLLISYYCNYKLQESTDSV